MKNLLKYLFAGILTCGIALTFAIAEEEGKKNKKNKKKECKSRKTGGGEIKKSIRLKKGLERKK